MPDFTLTERLLSVFDHLGIRRAHFATQSPGDIGAFIEQHHDRTAGICLLAPPRMDPAPFTLLGNNVAYVAPTGGTLGRTATTIQPRLPDAQSKTLDDYEAESWSDIAADRPDIADILTSHLKNIQTADEADGNETTGEISGIRYRAFGSGPILILTPLALAPSQWEPLLPELAKNFRVIALSGPHLGMLALLEQRASLSGWQHMCATTFDALDLSSGQHVLEVGCGSGAIARQFVHHTKKRNPLTAIDLSQYLLGEAQLSANTADIADIIAFQNASAEDLPFDTNAFDAAYTITVLEECNAKRAISELMRVVKPGGRIAIIVRAIDLAQWWNLPVNPEIRAKIDIPAGSVSPTGIATAELYSAAVAAGLKPLRQFPYTVASESVHGPVFEFPEAHALAQLIKEEQAAYQIAKAAAIADGTLFVTRGHHCFIGEVPN